jgi:flagellin-like protein
MDFPLLTTEHTKEVKKVRKGISPIVAVVLLIAIAVIAAVGLYFWVGGLATKQPTTDRPIPLNAQAYKCDLDEGGTTDNFTVLIQNMDSAKTLMNSTLPLFMLDDDGQQMIATTAPNISPSGQEVWVFKAQSGQIANLTRGFTYIIYGENVGQAPVIC